MWGHEGAVCGRADLMFEILRRLARHLEVAKQEEWPEKDGAKDGASAGGELGVALLHLLQVGDPDPDEEI